MSDNNWADQNRYVYDPSHELTIPSALVPELVFFIKKIRDHGTQNSATSSSSSATQVTLSLSRRQFAPILQTSRTEPQVPGPSAPMAPQPASTGVISPFQETSAPYCTNASKPNPKNWPLRSSIDVNGSYRNNKPFRMRLKKKGSG